MDRIANLVLVFVVIFTAGILIGLYWAAEVQRPWELPEGVERGEHVAACESICTALHGFDETPGNQALVCICHRFEEAPYAEDIIVSRTGVVERVYSLQD